jgi:hypothetical protein
MKIMTQTNTVTVVLALFTSTALSHPGHDFAPPEAFQQSGPGPMQMAFERRSSSPVNQMRDAGKSVAATNKVSISVEGNYRVIRGNGIPDHQTGAFPNSGNPNTMAPQNYNFLVPAKPQIAEKPTRLGMYPFGVAVNGVVFDPGAAEWWNGDPSSVWQFEPLSEALYLGEDVNNAHVQPTGAYHYHGVPTGLVAKLSGEKPKMTLVGWAADGFPIYGPYGYSDPKNTNSPVKKMKPSYRLKEGERPTNPGPGGKYDGSFVFDYEFAKCTGDLDECNGCFGPTREFPQGIYHYFVTEDFPFIPRSFKGVPDPSFFRQGPPGGGPGRGGPRGFPPPHGSFSEGRPPGGEGQHSPRPRSER